ncbi:glycine cleavage system protein T [Gemmatimonadetes bacterium T265]|nr:glycine cleavage system protein T [Gemmatimonadetes bacterium T265]
MSDTSEPAVIPISSARSLALGGTALAPAEAQPERDVATQYAALRSGALLVDHGARDLWTFRGPKAAETVTGLVTNDVAGLAPGLGCYAAALTAKGRIVADVRIFVCEVANPAAAGTDWLDGVTLVVDVPPRAAEGWGALIRKFVNPRSAPYRREHERLRAFGIYGVRARNAIADAFGAPPAALAALPTYAHATISVENTRLLVARVPDLGVDGFLLVGPQGQHETVWERVRSAVSGVVVGDEDAYTIARIEAGYPEWGVDIDETTIPQEANLDDLHAISYTKGCYTGQEVVARIHFRGHVNRHLRGIAYPPDDPAIPTGAELADEGGKIVGDVRSSAISPRLGGVAIGMVRREVPPGATLQARWEGGERGVTVSALPFPGHPHADPA